jgi:hypothetical protein
VNGTITGRGVSFWRTLLIDFDVIGTFDWETKAITLTKQHKGQFTNNVVYHGIITNETLTISGEYENGVINISKSQGKLYYTQPMTLIWVSRSPSPNCCVY